ncbi:MAG: DNA primase [Pseudomonadota bacterium]
MIPQHFIDDLIARADIVDVVGRRVQLKKAGREFKACCPFHDEKTPSFTVSPSKGFYHCFGCGAHGTALGFLMEYDHMSFVDAVETLAQSMGIEVPREEGERPAQRYDELFDLLRRVERFFQDQLRDHDAAIDYLKRRGVDGSTAKRFGVGFAPEGWSTVLDKFGTTQAAIDQLLAVGLIIRKDNGKNYDRFRNRVMFPIRDSRGRTIGFGGRVMGDEEPKYLNSPETVLFHKGRELYGLHEARLAMRNIERLVVVEGYMDVIGLARHGIDYGVATLGTATTGDHLNRLFRLADDIYFAFDGDRAGRKAAWRALENALPHMREGRQIRFVFLPEQQDPDSYVQAEGANAFERLLTEGLPLAEFMIQELAADVDLESVDGRARLAERAGPLLRKLPDGVYRELLLDGLGDRVGIAGHRLTALLLKGDSPSAARRGPLSSSTVRRGGTRRGKQPSLVRRALVLALHEPTAAAHVDADELADFNRPGIRLLRSLIETVQAEPNISTAGLIERYRNDDEGRHLGQLATTEVPSDEAFDTAAELSACIAQLGQAAARERVDYLIEKQKVSRLSDDERLELRELGRKSLSNG